MDPRDAELLAAVCDGSERAFNQLVDRHQQAIRQFLRRVVGPADADDAAQETFLALWSQARKFQGGSTLRTWLLGIAWRKAKDLQRSWYRRRQRDTAWLADTDAAVQPSGEKGLALEQALVSLSLEQRAA